VVTIAYQHAEKVNGTIRGNIPVLDVQYGNVWTNISDSLIKAVGWTYGDSLMVTVSNKDSVIIKRKIIFKKTFGEVNEGSDLAYINSLMNFSLAINMGDFSKRYNIYSGPTWTVVLSRP
jgi:S-adenosylmethionine hydrolase